MSNELAKPALELDGFEGFSNRVEGADDLLAGVSLLGIKLKYLSPLWTDPDGREVKGPLVALDIIRRVLKWLDDSGPAETIVLKPGEPWPDIDAMNAKCPQSEWHEKFGKMQGPWQGEHVVVFFDPHTMSRYWWPSPLKTVGSAICVRELAAQVKLRRSYQGEHVFAEVGLSHTHMLTAYGDRERPCLVVIRFVRFGDGDSTPLPAPETPALSGPAEQLEQFAAEPSKRQTPSGVRTVDPPSAKEVTGDEIRF